MNISFLRYFLPVYFLLFFFIAFVLKSIIVARHIGKNPMVLPENDSPHGLIGFYLKLGVVLIFVYVIAFAVDPNIHWFLGSILFFDNNIIQQIGIGLMMIALVWVVIAQLQMKDSWRIGIDDSAPAAAPLVTKGLFRFSRNPIFLGLVLCLIGLFLCTANAVTGVFVSCGFVLIDVQIRLEEEFLLKMHGEEFTKYRQNVRRWL